MSYQQRKSIFLSILILIQLQCAAEDFKARDSACSQRSKKQSECFEQIITYCALNQASADKPITTFCNSQPVILLFSCVAIHPECPANASSSTSSSSNSAK
ncbi:hypothetical protein EHQ76_03170 [Leptospira barantonii]|uniref:Cys-rich protein n=1 Tax=Leptospira barantonii TaxID=2023184 RepID=A0A5F2BSJ7_9LEPT|nr:hypothetical protein [Leptospira barantonii]TGM08964.1 hypothetical protein EHQ76_03170 [Leptospira barantonii]